MPQRLKQRQREIEYFAQGVTAKKKQRQDLNKPNSSGSQTFVCFRVT